MDSEVLAQMNEDFTQDGDPAPQAREQTLDYTDATQAETNAPNAESSLNARVKYFQFSGFNPEV